MFLGSTYIDKQLLFSKFCSSQCPSYMSWLDGWVVCIKWDYDHLSQQLKLELGLLAEIGNNTALQAMFNDYEILFRNNCTKLWFIGQCLKLFRISWICYVIIILEVETVSVYIPLLNFIAVSWKCLEYLVAKSS